MTIASASNASMHSCSAEQPPLQHVHIMESANEWPSNTSSIVGPTFDPGWVELLYALLWLGRCSCVCVQVDARARQKMTARPWTQSASSFGHERSLARMLAMTVALKEPLSRRRSDRSQTLC